MSLSYIYKYRSLRQIIQHNTNSKVQIRDFILKAIKYHTCVNIKIMMDNEIPSLSIRLRSSLFIRSLRRMISTGLPSSSSNSLFKWEREKPLRLTLVINIYITTFRQISNYAIVVKYCNNLPFLSHPFPQHILPYPIPNTRYIRPVHEREVRQEGADEGTALDQLEGRRVVG